MAEQGLSLMAITISLLFVGRSSLTKRPILELVIVRSIFLRFIALTILEVLTK